MKKPLIQLMKEAGLEWPAEANFAAQDKRNNEVHFYKCRPGNPDNDDDVWLYHTNDHTSVCKHELPELCKKWRKTLITKDEYLGAD